MNDFSGNLKLAVPNKGALSEGAVELLRKAGYRCTRGGRELVIRDAENKIDFVFLRPRDIALYVGGGIIDAGITGIDLARDSGAQVATLFPLGFGRSRFCFAAPKERHLAVEQLNGLRIATSYPALLKSELARRGWSCPVVKLDGAVEISIALGVADAIADVVDSGATLREGEYTVTSNVDPETPGEYAVTVEAMDRHGNTSAASCPVTVLPKRVMERPELRGLRYGDAGLPYVVLINRIANTVTVCTKDEEGDTVPVKAMVCSTGPATPRAGSVYRVAGRWRWLGLFGPCYGQYATQIVGNILFHSVPYFTQDPSDLEYEEYNQLGTACSMGCIRLTVEDALWIYENVPRGTYVVFYNDADNPGPLGKPTPPTIDVNSPNRGWDPTDPDPENPWHKEASAAPPAGEAGEGEANDGEAAPDTP